MQASKPRASQRVENVLKERIRSGVYPPGEQLPTERTLAEELDVHRRSVRLAVWHLVSEGLVKHSPRCRPIVAANQGDLADKGRARVSTSNLVALIMSRGSVLEPTTTFQERIFWGMNDALTRFGYNAVFLDSNPAVRGNVADHDQGFSPSCCSRSREEHAGAGWDSLPGGVDSGEALARSEARHLRYVLDSGFGGAVFYPYAIYSNLELVQEVVSYIPLVLLDRKIPGINVDFVGVENRRGMHEATQHLLSLGHRRIVHITGSEALHTVRHRVDGYVDAVRGADIPDVWEAVITIPYTNRHSDNEWVVFDAVFGQPPERRPTAAACFTDIAAVDVAKRLCRLGLTVPCDVSVTGFDNIIPTLHGGAGLTTLAQPFEEIGAKAVDLMMRRLRRQNAEPMSVELPARLIVRSSSDPSVDVLR